MIKKFVMLFLLTLLLCGTPILCTEARQPMTMKNMKTVFQAAYEMSSAEVIFLQVAPLVDPEGAFQKEISRAREEYIKAMGKKLEEEQPYKIPQYIFYTAAVEKYPDQAENYLKDCRIAHVAAIKTINALVDAVTGIGAPEWVLGFLKNSYGSIDELIRVLGKKSGEGNISKDGMAASLRWCVENARVVASLRDLLSEAWVRDYIKKKYRNGNEIEWFYQAGLVLPFWVKVERVDEPLLKFWLSVTTQSLTGSSPELSVPSKVPKAVLKNFHDLYVYSELPKKSRLKTAKDVHEAAAKVREAILKM